MKIMITTTTKDTHKRLSTNSENGSFQNRPHLISGMCITSINKPTYRTIILSPFIGICYPDVSNGGYAIRK